MIQCNLFSKNKRHCMTLTSLSLIKGIALGVEYVDAIPEENIPKSIILDVFFFRFIFTLGAT